MKDPINVFFSDYTTIIYEFEDAYNTGKTNEMSFEEWFELNKMLIYDKMQDVFARGYDAGKDHNNIEISY